MSLDLNLPDDFSMPGDDVERLAAGGLLPMGIYACQVTDVKEVEAKTSGSAGVEFEFTVLDGPCRGQTVKDTLWDTDTVNAKRRPIFMARLGITVKNAQGNYVPNPAAKNWRDVIGAKVNVEVEHDVYDKKNGGKGTKSKVAFAGLHPYDPSKASGGSGGNAGTGPAANGPIAPSGNGAAAPFPAGVGVGAGAGAAPRYDTSDL